MMNQSKKTSINSNHAAGKLERAETGGGDSDRCIFLGMGRPLSVDCRRQRLFLSHG